MSDHAWFVVYTNALLLKFIGIAWPWEGVGWHYNTDSLTRESTIPTQDLHITFLPRIHFLARRIILGTGGTYLWLGLGVVGYC